MVFLMMIHSIPIVTGCFEEDMEVAPLEAQFQLLNASGNPAISFTEGEDIIFDYRIVNSGNEDITWKGVNEGQIPIFPVFSVWKNEDKLPFGSVYDPSLILFDLELGRTLAPGEEVVIRVTWLGDLNETEVNWGGVSYPGNLSLPKGKYIVEFEHMLEPTKSENFHVHVYLDFEVI